MSNATDNLFEAEKMIRDNFTGSMEKERTMEICKWLFSLNSKGNDHLIKCYKPKDRSIRFCIDRGHDCEGDRIGNTLITTIKGNFQIHILPPKDKLYTYLKPDGKYYRYIPSQYCRTLPMEDIKKHIMESYFTKLQKLGMSIPKFINDDPRQKQAVKRNATVPQDSGIPSRQEIESKIRDMGGEVHRAALKAAIKADYAKNGQYLNPDWWTITERNLMEWSKKG